MRTDSSSDEGSRCVDSAADSVGRGASRGASLAALIACVAVGLWFGEVRPQLQDVSYPTPDGRTVHLPTYLPGDCPFYRAAAASLWRDLDLDLRNDPTWSVLRPEGQLSLGARGEWYPKHPLLLPVAALPFYAAAGDPGLLLFNLVQLVGLDALIFLAARRFTGDLAALAIALWFAFGSLLRPAAYNFAPDVLSSLVVLGGYLALTSRRPMLAGLLFGLSVAAKWTNLLFLPVAAAYALVALGRRPALLFATACAPALALLGILNWHMFGSPLTTPYDRVLAPSGALEPSHRTLFSQPFWAGLWEQIRDPRLGLLRSAPQVLFALPGFALLFRRARAEALFVASLCAVQMAVFAPYRMWSASSYGHRFLMTVVTLCSVPVAALAQWALDPARSRAAAADRSP